MSKIMNYNIEHLDEVLKPVIESDAENGSTFYDEHIAVNTVEYLRHLADRGTVVGYVSAEEDIDLVLEELAETEEIKADNSYNYSAPYTHDLEIRKTDFTDNSGPYYIALLTHISGDVRCNYCDEWVVYQFNRGYDFYEAVQEYCDKHMYEFTLDGEKYAVRWGGAGEHFELTHGAEHLCYEFVPEPWDEEDFLQSVRKALQGE